MTPARILVLEDVDLEAKLLVRSLADHGYNNVVWKRDVAAAAQALSEPIPTIAIVDLVLGEGGSGFDLLSKIRDRDEDGYVYALVLTSNPSPDRLARAFELGADGFLTKPFQAVDLLARLHAGERIIRRDRELRTRASTLLDELRGIDVQAAVRALERAAALVKASAAPTTTIDTLLAAAPWTTLADAMRGGLVGFFGAEFERCEVRDVAASHIVAEVHLNEANKKLDVGIALVVDGANARRLAEGLMGEDVDVETACGLVMEGANILMGALKTMYAGLGYGFTAGLPNSSDASQMRAAYDQHPARQRLAFRAGEAMCEVWVRIAETRDVRVRARDLKEGMVVAEDVRDGKGMLLLRSGSRLTETSAERVKRLAPDVEVCVANAA